MLLMALGKQTCFHSNGMDDSKFGPSKLVTNEVTTDNIKANATECAKSAQYEVAGDFRIQDEVASKCQEQDEVASPSQETIQPAQEMDKEPVASTSCSMASAFSMLRVPESKAIRKVIR